MNASERSYRAVCNNFAEQCINCGACLKTCAVLEPLPLLPATLARQLLAAEQVPAEVILAAQQCSLCGYCSQACPLLLNPAELMQGVRYWLDATDQLDAGAYQPMLVDRPHHFFSLYRDSWQIDYPQSRMPQADVMFFPGCSLASYAPQLTRSAYQWLVGQGRRVSLISACCGVPLANIGLKERAEQYQAELAAQLRQDGIRQLVTACPNCHYALQDGLAGSDIEVVSLYQLLDAAGVRLPDSLSVSVHDSCPDRYSGLIGDQLRSLLQDCDLKELPHHGSLTQCCGAGGIVSMVAPQLSQQRAELRAAEIATVAADYCVSACMSCVKRLSGADPGGRKRPQVIHILELIFDQRVDQRQLQVQLEEMWQGQRGEQNLRLLYGGSDTLEVPAATLLQGNQTDKECYEEYSRSK